MKHTPQADLSDLLQECKDRRKEYIEKAGADSPHVLAIESQIADLKNRIKEMEK